MLNLLRRSRRILNALRKRNFDPTWNFIVGNLASYPGERIEFIESEFLLRFKAFKESSTTWDLNRRSSIRFLARTARRRWPFFERRLAVPLFACSTGVPRLLNFPNNRFTSLVRDAPAPTTLSRPNFLTFFALVVPGGDESRHRVRNETRLLVDLSRLNRARITWRMKRSLIDRSVPTRT